MSFFRSEPMVLCQMVLHSESAFNCLIELGYEGKVQFRNIYDGKPVINHQYTIEVQRCKELKRIISYLQQEIDDFQIKIVIYPDVDEDEIPEADDLKDMETTLQQLYEDLMQVVTNVEALKRKRLSVYEQLQVLTNIEGFFGQTNQAVLAWSDSVIMHLMKNEFMSQVNGVSDKMHLSFVTGTIPVERFATFETLLWRITHGYFVLKHKKFSSITPEEKSLRREEALRKYVFITFFTGHAIREKIVKICQGFGIQLFECPESKEERKALAKKLAEDLKDLDEIKERTQQHRFNLLYTASADLYIWRIKLNKMLMVYYILNRMSHVKHLHMTKYLQTECWIPSQDVSRVRDALLLGARRTAKGNSSAMFLPMLTELPLSNGADIIKPTYFILNKFTRAFQNLIDAYGTAQYRELNPAPYTIITFPFLFAVMFGDIGHGLIMFLFGLWMIVKEHDLEEKQRLSQEQSEIWNILFGGRYIITLMGGFSMYTGFIYNDIFSKSFNIFGSSWYTPFNFSTVNESHYIQLNPSIEEHYKGTPYIFGVDPVWDASGEHAIITSNSMKMKLAIILGVAQMMFGLILSAFNFIDINSYVELLLVFVPQLTFLACIFGYLVFLIFFKWIYYGGHIEEPYNSACAPSILIIFINMLLMKGQEEPDPGCETWMFESQDYIQIALLAIGLLCVPILLAGRPIYFMIQESKIKTMESSHHKNRHRRRTQSLLRKSMIYVIEEPAAVQEETVTLSELWIHSGIHCIESVLGAVSHTASYLRLWALSLAHDQLSTVLWNMVLKIGLTCSNSYIAGFVLYTTFMVWSVLTLAILVVMEGLSAFLHTLRLHWVEFQSKFYAGSGEPFRPFKFKVSSPVDRD